MCEHECTNLDGSDSEHATAVARAEASMEKALQELKDRWNSR